MRGRWEEEAAKQRQSCCHLNTAEHLNIPQKKGRAVYEWWPSSIINTLTLLYVCRRMYGFHSKGQRRWTNVFLQGVWLLVAASPEGNSHVKAEIRISIVYFDLAKRTCELKTARGAKVLYACHGAV